MPRLPSEVTKALARREAGGNVYEHSMRGFDNIADGIRMIVRGIRSDVANAQWAVSMIILEEVAKATPVDTSTCQSNWQLVASPNELTVSVFGLNKRGRRRRNVYRWGNRRGDTLHAVVKDAHDKYRQMLHRIAGNVRPMDTTIHPLFVGNKTPYLLYLDRDGRSSQAPKNFVAINAQKGFRKGVRSIKRELRVSGIIR